NSDVAQFIKQIVKSSKKAEILVRQLLAFSRKQIMRPRVLNINKNIAELQKMLRRMIGEDIEIEINPAKKIPFIKADPAQIEQIIINLFVNARDAVNANELLSNGKKITLETSGVILDKSFVREHVGSSAGPYIRISVSDNGCGMEKSVREQMFEPFFTTKEVGKGTGLGLSTVYGIVKQNNGYIHADSQPGKGSSFYIYWPVLEGPPAPEKKSKLKKRFKGGDENILFVEDDAQLREMALKMLRSFGYSVYDAANGEEALLLVGKNGLNIDLLITDLIMPKMNGKELASLLKKIMPNVKILYCSGYTDQQIVQNGTLEEDVNFLPKPFKREVLADKIRIVLDN
ncbi:MAG: response regulator, partial [bacterium]|nr:response regulator [bacterium]